MSLFALAVVLSWCVAISGCTTPVGVEQINSQTAYRVFARNVLSSGKFSEPTRIVLTRWDLSQRFATAPEAAIAALRARVADGTAGSDEIFALAELSLQHAMRTGKRSYYLGAAVYAFAFLFPDGTGAPPSPFDPRLRIACDIYNRSLNVSL